jgi:hypothetical protein
MRHRQAIADSEYSRLASYSRRMPLLIAFLALVAAACGGSVTSTNNSIPLGTFCWMANGSAEQCAPSETIHVLGGSTVWADNLDPQLLTAEELDIPDSKGAPLPIDLIGNAQLHVTGVCDVPGRTCTGTTFQAQGPSNVAVTFRIFALSTHEIAATFSGQLAFFYVDCEENGKGLVPPLAGNCPLSSAPVDVAGRVHVAF